VFYHLLYPLREYISGLNLFRYITFRAACAAVAALLISFLIGPHIVKLLRRKQIGEEIREDGPPTHQVKKGIPTMGGLIILGAVAIPTLLFARLDNAYIYFALGAFIWMGLLGFMDDYLKAVKKKKKGLVAKYKWIGQISLGIVAGIIILTFPEILSKNFADHVTETTMPFFKDLFLPFGILYIPVIIIVIAGTSNGVNLTDGLDGLAIGVVGIASAAMAGMCYVTGHIKFSDYLNIIYLDGSGELTVFCAAMLGASLGFLWFNAYPAEVFMGDTGALALGGALGMMAILIKKELFLIVIGGVFVIEALSVIIQRYYFKYTKSRFGEGRRVFRMAPIHHHFELSGWAEPKVVVRFWILEILLVLILFSMFKIR
jgi:phospho-N-acetylmuramoyl-pentapeptide-transferase